MFTQVWRFYSESGFTVKNGERRKVLLFSVIPWEYRKFHLRYGGLIVMYAPFYGVN